MKAFEHARIWLSIVASFLMTSCASLPVQVSVPPVPAASWMLSQASSSDLLYVADANDGRVDVYAYPSGKHVGKLAGFEGLAFLCTDKSGDIYIPDYGVSKIFEYAHGGTTPIATLSVGGDRAYACSVDPKSGDLAVADYADYGGGSGDLAIFRHARGKPTYFFLQEVLSPTFCAYDDAGDVFVEGYGTVSGGGSFGLLELVGSSHHARLITLQDVPAFPNGLQWNGTYLAVGTGTLAGPSTGDTYIYHVKIASGAGKTIGTTRVIESAPTATFLIDGTAVLVSGGAVQSSFKFFGYPGGGSPKKTVNETSPYGLAISLAH